MTGLKLVSGDNANDFSTEVLAEKKVKLIFTTPSGNDMTVKYQKEGSDEVITEPQHMVMLGDQSKRYKKAKSKLANNSINKKGKANYDEDEEIAKTANLIASVTTSMFFVAGDKIVSIDNSNEDKQYEIRDYFIKYPEFREQAVDVINDRAGYLGNSENS